MECRCPSSPYKPYTCNMLPIDECIKTAHCRNLQKNIRHICACADQHGPNSYVESKSCSESTQGQPAGAPGCVQLICENNTTTQTKKESRAQVMAGMCLHVTIRPNLTSIRLGCHPISGNQRSTASICLTLTVEGAQILFRCHDCEFSMVTLSG